MLLRNADITMTSGNPSSLIGGTNAKPWLAGATIEPIDREVNDVTAVTPAAVGYLLVQQQTAANIVGGANFLQCATANLAIPFLSYGIVYDNPLPLINAQPLGQTTVQNVGGQSTIRCSGLVYAYITTGTVAATYGTPLASTATGVLTTGNAAPTAVGVTLGFCMGTLAANTATPTLTLIKIGGY
jgi:hypothetical protein